MNLRNQRTHGVSFELAALAFEDELCMIGPGRHALGAIRNELGIVAVLLVVHVYREEHNGEEIIRIISARAAEKHELRRYREQKID
jgi:uncharacterized DUF497 family protein